MNGKIRFPATLMLSLGLLACNPSDDDKTEETNANNESPVITVENSRVNEMQDITISATATDDGSISSYEWQQVSGKSLALSDTASPSLTFTAPEVTELEELVLRLTVTDDLGASAQADVTVTVENVNQSPTIVVENITASEHTQVTLSASVTDDGEIASFAWQQLTGQPIELSGADTARLEFTAPEVSTFEELTFQISVTDNDGATTEETVTVQIDNVNQPPQILVEDISFVEKSDAIVSATISDDAAVSSIVWSQISGPTVTVEGSDSSEIQFTAPAVTEPEFLVFELMATDSEGLTTSTEVTVEIAQSTLLLNIVGVVTDAPIANADVTIAVAGTEQNIQADESGNYSAEIAVDDDAGSQLVVISAKGQGEQSMAKLTSTLGSMNALLVQAGDDQVLDKTENFDVNVTNITTAKTALMSRENLGAPIDSDEKLAELGNAIDPQQMMNLATAIKVAIDKSADNKELGLPEGVNDTLELVNNVEVLNTYIEQVAETEEFSQAEQEILNDENLVDKGVANTPAFYYFVPCNLCSGEFIRLYEGGEGEFFSATRRETFSWSVDDGTLSLGYGDNGYLSDSSTENVDINGESVTVSYHYFIESESFTQIFNDSDSTTFRKQRTGRKIYPNGELPEQEIISDSTVTALKSDSIADFSLATANLVTYALPLPNGAFSVEGITYLRADNFHLNTDGTGMAQTLSQELTWSLLPNPVLQNKLELVILLENGTELSFTQLNSNETHPLYAVTAKTSEEVDGGQGYGYVDTGGQVVAAEKFDLASVPGIYTYEFDGKSTDEFWWELWPGGAAYTIETKDENQDGQLSADEVSVMYGDWAVSDDGVLSITRWKDSSNWESSGCFGESSECYLWNRRSWQLFSRDDRVLHITNNHNFDFDADGVMDYVSFDNRKVNTASERPISVPLPDMGYLPEIAPSPLVGMLDPLSYTGQTLFAADHDYIWHAEQLSKAIRALQLDDSGGYIVTENGGSQQVGVYHILDDNTLLLENTEYEYNTNYGYFAESNDVVLGMFIGLPWPHFKTEQAAEEYISGVQSKTPRASFADWQNRNIFFVDQDDRAVWQVNYVRFTADNQIHIYTDDQFNEIKQTMSYILNDDGSISVEGSTDVMFISLQTDLFSIVVDEHADINSVDYNYLFTDGAQAANFAHVTNKLRISHN